jgi:Ca-activated chloride channel family protein
MVKDAMIRLKGGEIGSGHSLMAIFEIVPDSNTVAGDDWAANLQVHYSLPMRPKQYTTGYQCPNIVTPFNEADVSLRKAASVVMFGIKLKDAEYSGNIRWRSLQKIAAGCFDKNRFLDKEFLQLIGKAKKMYTHRRKYGGD